ncbi:molybdopterin-dependent oxidoreductase [Hydrocarboniphaga sp.]|uniref:molybdopterin-dependent oxidoreductase n=1 Tax=Hydrocarboniphaga sp. TaxID=2033016 RepID=UPI003D09979B
MKRLIVRVILFALTPMLKRTAAKHPEFRAALKKYDFVAQIKLKDGSVGRTYTIREGSIESTSSLAGPADVQMIFHDVDTALSMLKPNADMAEVVHAAKNFKVLVLGRNELVVAFMQLLNRSQTVQLTQGTTTPDGCARFTTNTNAGPLFIYVKDGRIVRVTPIELEAGDASSWTIEARGRQFTPERRTTVAPHGLALKSTVYSEQRLQYPMKRVDFDPKGERNPQNRGKSGYVRISWDEALSIVTDEIKRQKQVHGPGSIAIQTGSHHQWGNVGYYLSALLRFGNLIGFTRVHPNPDSWEGWYWGAQHHFGNSMRVGIAGNYGTTEDCLKNAEMMVFWSSDPESTNGAYAAYEGTQRRLWAKQLGIEFVHIDPHFNPTAQLLGGKWFPIKPTTDPALAIAIMYVWITEELYDRDYVANRTTGFDEWRAYVLGESDGVPKTPEWQQLETGIPAREVRALARKWGTKKTYLAVGAAGGGFGGACRSATGAQWARCMVMLMAMRGWGKPGINFGNLTTDAPVDLAFYFPGYADGGISGDLAWTAAAVNNYTRMPHVLSMNPVKQIVPRQRLPEAIMEGSASGYLWDGTSTEAQFAPFTYPMAGYSPIRMLYRYGTSTFSTIVNSSRWEKMYQHESLEFVVCQAIWNEGDAQFADIILPACTQLERTDISEWCNPGGYLPHGFNHLNHRVVVMQHKCIEPLGESKSDYQIFLDILTRMGLGAIFSEGCSELDWCKRVFDSSDLPKHISWSDFLKKGYYVVAPAADGARPPVTMRWFAEGRHKDEPEPAPLPSQYSGEFGLGLPTQSGKFEFIPQTLTRVDPKGLSLRPPLNRYIPAWEGAHSTELVRRYPLPLITSHTRYSFHTQADGKNSFLNNVEDHRVLIDGHHYWLLRVHPHDAAERGITHHDLIKVFNDRGIVICAADVSPLVARGVVKSFESSAVYAVRIINGERVDFGGCMNTLTPGRSQSPDTESMAPNSCLVQIERWTTPMPEAA